ncbi:MAG: asparagine synthase (glutamine-hydrolyzing) [Bdellovibrionota bacterium]
MCGIAGFIEKKQDSGTLNRMLSRISHRGPDDEGSWLAQSKEWQIHLGHRRLSIIDIEGGKQPLGNDDGSVQIVFNGEIFNFADLKSYHKLGNRFRFKTRSDTEVLLRLFEAQGLASFSALNGMFAFAVWNRQKEELILARDRAGIKPLYYAALPDGGLIFASELAAFFEHPRVDKALSHEALSSYFFQDYVHSPGAILSGVKKLSPGHYVRWNNGRTSAQLPFVEEGWLEAKVSSFSSEEELKDLLWQSLSLAVKRQLVADVPVGVFLSGGIDSSCIATLAQANSTEPIQTFSIAFEEKTFDESEYARLVSQHIKSRHFEQRFTEADMVDRVSEILSSLDEPMADPSLIPTYILSELASKQVKVVLGGDGGDELWAGYPTYLAHKLERWMRWIPESARQGLIDPVIAKLPVEDRYQPLEWKLKRFFLRWDKDPFACHLRWLSNTDLKKLKEAVSSFTDPLEQFTRLSTQAGEKDLINQMLRLDFQTYLPGSVLTKVDRASMAHGLEVRPPFLDNEFVRWSFSLPSHYKLRGKNGKYLLKKAAAEHLPREILTRKKKGFGIPLSKWIRGPLQSQIKKTLEGSPLWDSNYLNRTVFKEWNQKHAALEEDNSKPLWALLVLDHWAKKNGIR